ncbi:MAG: thioesterase [Lachnospiraceae bacterium]|nr:thioesterase [Lachnospiraceae bacterium]
MIFEKDYLPMFRESEANGLIGIKGYLYYFQDMTTHYLHNLGKGNDTLPEEYGICCMYTKYRVHLEKQADYTKPLHMETWLEKNNSHALLYQGFSITRDGTLYASGRVESCFFDMTKGRLTRPEAVDFPKNKEEERLADVEPFLKKMMRSADDMEYRYTHTVHYTDLDKMGHMTNLKYVDLLLNAFDSQFYKAHMATDLEIHYVNQCFESEAIRVYVQTGEACIWLLGLKENGSIAVQGMLKTV